MITSIKTKDREEWKALRKKYIGGSDAASVVGLNPFKSALELWADKTGKIPDFEGNLATEVGTYLEEFVAQKFAEVTGKKVRRNNRSIFNDKYPWAIANIDREIVGEDAVLEIKTTSEMNLKKFNNGEYPANYYCQVMHYLAVTEKKKGYLAVLIGNREFKVFEIERDETEIESLMNAEKELYELIKTDVAPDPDGTKSSSETINALNPISTDKEIDLTSFKVSLAEYSALGEQIKTLKTLQDKIANNIKVYMGDAGKGRCDGYSVSYTTSVRNAFDSKKFIAEHRGINLDPYYNTTTQRTFRVTQKG